MRRYVIIAACSAGLVLAAPASAWAIQNPTTGHRGSPNFMCTAGTNTPGNSVNAGGSPFNPNGQAGLVYAGNPNTASSANANSTAAVAQYDVACL